VDTRDTDDTRIAEQHGHPSRNPMFWLVWGLPALVMVAAFATLAIAIRAGGSDALPDDVRRMAQIQTTDLSADEFAATQKLSAVLRISESTLGESSIEILPAGGDVLKDERVRAQTLTLSLQHPSRAAEDRALTLRPSGHGWRVAETLDLSHDWRVQIAAADGRWRLHGRLLKASRSTLLQPALADAAPTEATRQP
jgi:uncharacterized protein